MLEETHDFHIVFNKGALRIHCEGLKRYSVYFEDRLLEWVDGELNLFNLSVRYIFDEEQVNRSLPEERSWSEEPLNRENITIYHWLFGVERINIPSANATLFGKLLCPMSSDDEHCPTLEHLGHIEKLKFLRYLTEMEKS